MKKDEAIEEGKSTLGVSPKHEEAKSNIEDLSNVFAGSSRLFSFIPCAAYAVKEKVDCARENSS